MQLTAQDKRAAREGFKYVVVRAGERVCYTTTLGEAKRECGKSGKVVSISGMRYTAKNPSSGAKQRARGTRSYGDVHKLGFVEAAPSGRHARMLDYAAKVRRKSAKLGPAYTKLMHREALAEAARVRNPHGDRDPSYITVVYSETGRAGDYEYVGYANTAAGAKELAKEWGFPRGRREKKGLMRVVKRKIALLKEYGFPDPEPTWVVLGPDVSTSVRNPSRSRLPKGFKIKHVKGKGLRDDVYLVTDSRGAPVGRFSTRGEAVRTSRYLHHMLTR